jgi:hypothetical protein
MNEKSLRFTTMKYTLLILVIGSALLAGCSRSGSTGGDQPGPHIINNNDSVAPVVDIYTPTTGQVITTGSNINITGKVTDDGGLYRGSIRITNDANGGLIKEQLYEIHGFQSYSFTLAHPLSVMAPFDYTVTVSFEDHGGNSTSKSVKFKVTP